MEGAGADILNGGWVDGSCHRYDFLVRLIGMDLIFFELLFLHLGLITTPMFTMFT